MDFPAILAHGALGWWDEMIYVSIAVIFVVFMAVSWLRSRNADLGEEAEESVRTPSRKKGDRFKLD